MWVIWHKVNVYDDCSKQIYLMCSQFDDNEWILWHHSGNDSSKWLLLLRLNQFVFHFYSVPYQNVDHWLPPYFVWMRKLIFFLEPGILLDLPLTFPHNATTNSNLNASQRKHPIPDFLQNRSLTVCLDACILHSCTMHIECYNKNRLCIGSIRTHWQKKLR